MTDRRRRTQLERVALEALAIEAEEAQEAGALAFMARLLVQTTMPHRNHQGTVFQRRNGNLCLSITSPDGLPWGRYPRLLLAWVTTEATRTKSPVLQLGGSLSAFMRELGLAPTGGRWGTIPRLRDQVRRLFTATISCTLHDRAAGTFEDAGYRVADRTELWWDPRIQADQLTLFGSQVHLSAQFFAGITDRPVPVDMRVLQVLRSPLALDIYCWLTYRNSYLRRPTSIPWAALALQFGSEYGRLRAFREAFIQQAHQVLAVYPDARIEATTECLTLRPAPTHVRRRTE